MVFKKYVKNGVENLKGMAMTYIGMSMMERFGAIF